MTRVIYKKRPSVAEARLLPTPEWIVPNPITAELEEPYCVFMQDDEGKVGAIVYHAGQNGTLPLTRTYWPGHADHRWPPTRLATTAAQARWLLAERPEQMVAIPESLVVEMYRGNTLAFTAHEPE